MSVPALPSGPAPVVVTVTLYTILDKVADILRPAAERYGAQKLQQLSDWAKDKASDGFTRWIDSVFAESSATGASEAIESALVDAACKMPLAELNRSLDPIRKRLEPIGLTVAEVSPEQYLFLRQKGDCAIVPQPDEIARYRKMSPVLFGVAGAITAAIGAGVIYAASRRR